SAPRSRMPPAAQGFSSMRHQPNETRAPEIGSRFSCSALPRVSRTMVPGNPRRPFEANGNGSWEFAINQRAYSASAVRTPTVAGDGLPKRQDLHPSAKLQSGGGAGIGPGNGPGIGADAGPGAGAGASIVAAGGAGGVSCACPKATLAP